MSQNKSSISRLQLSNFKLNTLLDITLSINDNVSTVDLLAQYENLLRGELNIGRVVILSYNHKKWECILNSGYPNEINNPQEIVESQLCNYSEISNLSSVNEGLLQPFDVVIPVFNKGEAVSYVLVGDIDEDREGISPTIKHLKFIQTITNVIVVAIENKRLYQENLIKEAFKKELELASRMQNMLIPNVDTLPSSDRLGVATYYNPHSEVGGDYYDFLKLSATEFGFCIADVSGKGISAALLMSNFQANLRALFTSEISLENLVVRLNASVMSTANGEKFITFFVGKYNIESRKLQYINAGHNPPVLQSTSRSDIDYLKVGCVGLGMFDEIPVVHKGEVMILPKDRLVCYTDGLSEAENEDQEEFGTIPLEGCLSEADNILSALNAVVNKMTAFTANSSLSDDVSILAIEFF